MNELRLSSSYEAVNNVSINSNNNDIESKILVSFKYDNNNESNTTNSKVFTTNETKNLINGINTKLKFTMLKLTNILDVLPTTSEPGCSNKLKSPNKKNKKQVLSLIKRIETAENFKLVIFFIFLYFIN